MGVLLHMTQTLIVNALDSGVLKIPPPILSRVFQTLSRGFVNLLNAKKITDTRFPFPYAQLLSILLFLHMIMTPVMISNLIESWPWACIFTFVPIFGMFSLNFVAIELENPFGDDDNDLPLLHFQKEMNNCLLMLLEDNADMVAGTSTRRCIRDFKKLHQMLQTDREEDDCNNAPTAQGSRRLSAFDNRLSMDDFEPEPEEEEMQDAASKNEPANASPPVTGGSSSPLSVSRRLEHLEAMLGKSVETVERTFEQWMLKAVDHNEALRRNTDAITQLVMVHV